MDDPLPPPDPDELLEETEKLRRLAAALTRDADLAEDVIQDARLTALRDPPAAGRPLAGWLRTAVRHLARRARRSAARRSRHERQGARPEVTTSTAAVAERLEVLRLALDALRELEEPYRSALVLRHLEGRPPATIAAARGVPVETVKTWLKRGLARLRAHLDAEHPGGRASWTATLAPLAPAGAAGAASSLLALLGGVLMAKTTLAVAAIALVILAWSSWSDRDARDETASRSAAPVPPAAALDSQEPAAASAAAPLPAAPLLAEPAGDAAHSEMIEILVVAAETGAPLPGAVVHFRADDAALPEGHRLPRQPFEGLDLEQEMAATTARAVADGDGRLLVPRPATSFRVSARHGARWSLAAFHASEPSPIRIALPVETSIAIQTVDGDGLPIAGVPVVIQARVGSRWVEWYRGATAGPEALAVKTNARFWLINRPHALRATLGPLFPEGPTVAFDRDHLPAAPVRLMVPPTGRVVIDLVDDGGLPFLEPAFVGLGLADGLQNEDDHWIANLHWVEAQGGRTVFPHVGLGLALTARIASVDHTRERPDAALSGPTSAGEEVRVTLKVGRPLPVLSGRALGPDGRPLAAVRLLFECRPPGDEVVYLRFSGYAVTEEDGRFRSPVELGSRAHVRARAGDVLHLRVYRPPHLRSRLPGDAERSATLPVPLALVDGRDTDLGDVAFLPEPLLAGGRVAGASGAPMAGVSVRLESSRTGARGFTSHPAYEFTSRDDGSFEIYGVVPAGDLRVVAVKDDHVQMDPVALASPGVSDLRIVLVRSGALEGSVILPAGVPASALCVSPTGPIVGNARDLFEHLRHRSLTPEGRFAWPTLRPGRGGLRIAFSDWGASGDGEAVLEIEDIVIAPGETCRDPRLQAIDLREILKPVDVRVTDDGGRAIPLARLRLHPASGDDFGGRRRETGADGRQAVLVGPTPVSVEVSKEGYLTSRAPLDAPAVSIVLRPAIALHLTLTGAWPSAEFEIEASVMRKIVYADMPTWTSLAARVVPRGEATVLPVTDTSRVHLVVVLRRRGEVRTDGILRQVRLIEHPLDLRPGDAEHHLTLELDALALDQAMARLPPLGN